MRSVVGGRPGSGGGGEEGAEAVDPTGGLLVDPAGLVKDPNRRAAEVGAELDPPAPVGEAEVVDDLDDRVPVVLRPVGGEGARDVQDARPDAVEAIAGRRRSPVGEEERLDRT